MIRFHILTLFPDMVYTGLNESILKRAIDGGLIEIDCVNIRDYTENKHNKVDDYTYGGGAGMLMQAQPVYDCIEAVEDKITSAGRKRAKVIYVTPRGRVFDQSIAKEYSVEEDIIIQSLLDELKRNGISYKVHKHIPADNAHFPLP